MVPRRRSARNPIGDKVISGPPNASRRAAARVKPADARVPTVHLVYPHGGRVACPDAIGRHLGAYLARDYPVRYYDHHLHGCIHPQPGDILIGHPHPGPLTLFRRSACEPGWSRVLALSPYNEDVRQVWFLDRVLPTCDLFLAITGRYWAARLPSSRFAHWQPKFRHLDLAVDQADFPSLKAIFNPAGKRCFVYVGQALPCKNIPYLTALARAMPDTRFDWVGVAHAPSPLQARGFLNFASPGARARMAEYDFMVTVGSADANPTTVLEAMAWGLIPVCTPQSGYVDQAGIVNVPLDDVDGAVRVLRDLQTCDAARLQVLQQRNRDALDVHFNWERFGREVQDAIQSDEAPALSATSPGPRLAIRLAALRSRIFWKAWAATLVRLVLPRAARALSR